MQILHASYANPMQIPHTEHRKRGPNVGPRSSKKVLLPTRTCLTQAGTSLSNTFSKLRGAGGSAGAKIKMEGGRLDRRDSEVWRLCRVAQRAGGWAGQREVSTRLEPLAAGASSVNLLLPQPVRRTDRKTERQKGRKTERQKERERERQTERPKDREELL